MKNILFYLSLLPFLLLACQDSPSTSKEQTVNSGYYLDEASWILGDWENHTTSRGLNESWSRLNDSVFLGLGTFMDGDDTLSSERIQLEQIGNELFYVPVVDNQNQGMPVRFKMKEKSGKHLLFENANHDFPQFISYTLIKADSMVAKISGNMDGKYHEQDFPFKRMTAASN